MEVEGEVVLKNVGVLAGFLVGNCWGFGWIFSWKCINE